MTTDTERGIGPSVRRGAIWIVLGAVFAISHTQDILYSSNQNTKLLHGLAKAGEGFLSRDWTANTIDPLPIFSDFVAFTYKHLGPFFFYVYFAALLAIFVYAAMGIFARISNLDRALPLMAAFYTALVLMYSRTLWVAVTRVAHHDVIRRAVYGLAQQYLLGDYFQNSVFSVFVVLSILLFLRGRPVWAAVAIGFACTVHSAYLFASAGFTLAYMFLIVKNERKGIKALAIGALTLALVLPVVLYSRSFLSETTPEASRRAVEILAVERIPQHSLVSVWFEPSVVAKLAIIAVALYLLRKNDLFWILAIPFALGLAVTLYQIATGNLTLALLAPWRISVFLVPLSELTIIAFALSWLYNKLSARHPRLKTPILAVCALLVAGSFAGGLSLELRWAASFRSSDLAALFSYVERNRSSGDLYLVPPTDGNLERLRIQAGVPVVITWKSHPYKDVQVLEWYQRVKDARTFYDAPDPAAAAAALASLKAGYGVTHVVTRAEKDPRITPAEGTQVYAGGRYALYRLNAALAAGAAGR